MNYHLLRLRARRARACACRCGSTTASRCRRVVGVWPTADWHEREAWDMMGIRDRGPSEPEADPDGRRLGGPPAAQGLPDRRRAGAVLGAGVDGDRRAGAARADLRGLADPAADPDGAPASRRSSRLRGRADGQLRAEPPVDARRAAARSSTSTARTSSASTAVIGYLHTGFEKNMEQKTWWKAITYPRADRLPLLPEQRARLRARDREAARARDAAEGDLDAHAASAS